MRRNPHLKQLSQNYLFQEIQKRKQQFLLSNPYAQLISLGIGDTTQPLPSAITERLASFSHDLGTREGYRGYGAEQGLLELREKLAQVVYQNRVSPDEIFISDGTKCDLGRLQALFGKEHSVAIQDPSYPVYIDGSQIQGISSIYFMPCTADNRFFPDLSLLPHIDLLYFCSPNNPTGAAATREQLTQLVQFAKEHKALILFDAAYAEYIRDPSLPKSIFEIPGAQEVAIEMGSFSKWAGFTGVRLGWTVVPKSLKYEEGGSIWQDWNRINSTLFNGASIIAQQGALAALSHTGELKKGIDAYLANAALLKNALTDAGVEVYGGDNAPYLWAHFPGKSSWEVFQELLENAHLITTPGIGFGFKGEGYLRFSSYSPRDQILEAAQRLVSCLHFL